MSLQSEEVECVHDDCSKVSEQFELLYCSFLSLLFDPPFVESLPPYIALLNHLHPPLVDHPNPYLSTCPISHLPYLSVSCISQGSTV